MRKKRFGKKSFWVEGVLHLGISLQLENGSPVYPASHWHIELWLITVQIVCTPHAPIQGSLHRSFIHANVAGHSADITHSGRQFGARPI